MLPEIIVVTVAAATLATLVAVHTWGRRNSRPVRTTVALCVVTLIGVAVLVSIVTHSMGGG